MFEFITETITNAPNMLMEQLRTNQFFSGGIMLTILGGAGYYIKPFFKWIYEVFARKVRYSVYFDQNDKIFIYFNRWLADSDFKVKIRNVQVTMNEDGSKYSNDSHSPIGRASNGRRKLSKNTDVASQEKEEKGNPEYFITQKEDSFVIWYKKHPIVITKTQEKLEHTTDRDEILYNHYTLSGLFAKSKLHSLIEEVMRYKDEEDNRNIIELYVRDYSRWDYQGDLVGRSMESVIMDEEVKKKLLADVNEFLSAEEWYYNMGITYKRGYLFYGSPGSGKTSIVKALATYTKFKLHYLNLTSDNMDDESLVSLASNVKSPCMLIVEDIDAIFDGRKNITKSKISFSGLLNCLDGIFSSTGTIVVFTTNHIEKLDPALIRSSRIDMQIELSFPKWEQIKEYFKMFYGKEIEAPEHQIKKVSMAKIQDICMVNKENSEEAKKEIYNIIKTGE